MVYKLLHLYIGYSINSQRGTTSCNMSSSKKEYILHFILNLFLWFMFGIGKILLLFPCTSKLVYKKMKTVTVAENDEDFKKILFTKMMREHCVKILFMSILKTIKLHREIPNLPILEVTKANETIAKSLHVIQRTGVPLVLNFGSCS